MLLPIKEILQPILLLNHMVMLNFITLLKLSFNSEEELSMMFHILTLEVTLELTVAMLSREWLVTRDSENLQLLEEPPSALLRTKIEI